MAFWRMTPAMVVGLWDMLVVIDIVFGGVVDVAPVVPVVEEVEVEVVVVVLVEIVGAWAIGIYRESRVSRGICLVG